MSIRAFDFLCLNGHVSESFEESQTRVVSCPECGQLALRQVASPRAKLEGITGAFPSAADNWERTRESHMARERRNMDKHRTYK
jgi:hypothetical protein